MPLIYITGLPSSGKSTLHQELLSQGYKSYDIDDISDWYIKGTNLKVENPEPRPIGFIENHDWKVDLTVITKLTYSTEPVFICGSVANDKEIWPLFNYHFYLELSNSDLKERLSRRTGTDFGSNADERQAALEWNQDASSYYSQQKAIFLDASKPPQNLLAQIKNYIFD